MSRVRRGLPLYSRAAEKAHSRKSISIHSHAYAVPGRMRAGLFIELPRRVLLGSWLHRGNYKDQTTPYCALTLVHMCCRNTAIILVPVLLSLSPLSDGHQIFSHSPTDPLCCQRQAHTSKPTLNVH